MLRFIKENKAFAVIFLLAVIIRFLPVFRYQYSYDELCGLRNSIYANWHDMIEYGVKLDTHPILVQLIINATVSVFGYEAFWVKLPFLLFSLGSIIYAFLFSLKWYGRSPALITASIFSFSYIFLFYAPLARMYSGGAFFCTALTYYLFEICFSEHRKTSHYVLFVVFILLASLNNHLSCLYAFSCGVAGLFFQNKATIFKYLGACLAAIALYLPHLPITMAQLAQGGIGHSQDGWLPVPEKWVLFSFLRTLFGTGYVWILFVVLIVTGMVLAKEFKVNRKTVVLLLLFFFNYALIHWYSVYKAPVFQNSVMLFSAPCIIWAVTGVIKLNARWGTAASIIICFALIYQSVIGKHFFTSAVLNQNGFQSIRYCQMEDKCGKGKVEAYFMNSQRYFVILHELKHNRRFNYFIGEDFGDLASFKSRIVNSKADHILLGEPSYSQLEIAKEYFPYVDQHGQNVNVNCYVLSRNKEKKRSGCDFSAIIKSRPAREKVLNKSNLSDPDKFEYGFTKEKMSDKVLKVDSLDEFCFSAKAELKDLSLREGNVILAKMKLQSGEQLNDVGFNFSIANDKDSTLFFGGPDIGQFYTRDSTGYYAYCEVFMGSNTKYWLDQNSKITFFIWNRSKKKFTLSDFEIKLIDYWPSRWSWWE